jgi:hypothetical protein
MRLVVPTAAAPNIASEEGPKQRLQGEAVCAGCRAVRLWGGRKKFGRQKSHECKLAVALRPFQEAMLQRS